MEMYNTYLPTHPEAAQGWPPHSSAQSRGGKLVEEEVPWVKFMPPSTEPQDLSWFQHSYLGELAKELLKAGRERVIYTLSSHLISYFLHRPRY